MIKLKANKNIPDMIGKNKGVEADIFDYITIRHWDALEFVLNVIGEDDFLMTPFFKRLTKKYDSSQSEFCARWRIKNPKGLWEIGTGCGENILAGWNRSMIKEGDYCIYCGKPHLDWRKIKMVKNEN